MPDQEHIRSAGLLDYQLFLAGRSNAGLTEPGQNAVITLTRLAVLVCMSEPNFDDLVAGSMMVTLGRESQGCSPAPTDAFEGTKKLCWRAGGLPALDVCCRRD